MSIKLKYKQSEFETNCIIWDRDSFFVDFNCYWSRLTALIAQHIAEHTTNNWGNFNLIRTKTIKLLGIDSEKGTAESSSPIKILPLNIFPYLLAINLKEVLQDKSIDELNCLFRILIDKSLKECQSYIKSSVLSKNIGIIKELNKKTKQTLITNDSKENNDLFLNESGLINYIDENYPLVFKEQLNYILDEKTIFLTNNLFLYDSFLKQDIKQILLIEDIGLVSFEDTTINNLIEINVDGASRGNPGESAIGIVFTRDNKIIDEVSEYLGIHTNNYAEYTALIRALEISKQKEYKNIEIF